MAPVSGVQSNRDYFGDAQRNDGTTKTDNNGQIWNAEFTDKKEKSVSVDDFLNLMVAQLQNQDFMNPVDDTQYVAQLAQFASMQQMQELAAYSKSNYVMSLVGKDVTAAKFTVSGDLDKTTGPVERVTLANDEYTIYIKDKPYTLDQIMEIHSSSSSQGEREVDPSKYSIIPGDKTSTSIDIEWPVPTTDTAAASRLKYTVYYSTEGPFDTVEEVEAGIRLGEAERQDLYKEKLENLHPDTPYYINVVVTDSDGTKKTYKSLLVRTEKDKWNEDATPDPQNYADTRNYANNGQHWVMDEKGNYYDMSL